MTFPRSNPYSKELDTIEDLIIDGEVVAWDHVKARIFLKLPRFSSVPDEK